MTWSFLKKKPFFYVNNENYKSGTVPHGQCTTWSKVNFLKCHLSDNQDFQRF